LYLQATGQKGGSGECQKKSGLFHSPPVRI
jgi:hypothetical protein